MLLVKTKVAPSKIHGVGVFALEPISKGILVWRWDPYCDRIIPRDEAQRKSSAFADFLFKFAWRRDMVGCPPGTKRQDGHDGDYYLCGDHKSYINHSNTPNLSSEEAGNVALVNIEPGTELTVNYFQFFQTTGGE